MKNVLITIMAVACVQILTAQIGSDEVRAACQDYIDAFYKGDTLALKRSFSEHLNKFGYWKNEDSGEYKFEGYMSYDQALAYSVRISESKKYPAAEAPQIIEVLDVMNHIACAKITAWWGVDYLQLSNSGGSWTIQQVIWEGPLQK